jgi:hypothetical protein
MAQPRYVAVTIGLDPDLGYEVTRWDAGAVSLDFNDVRLITDDPAVWESLAASCLSAANALRVPGGVA